MDFRPTPSGGIGSKQHSGSSNRGCACLGGAVAPPVFSIYKVCITCGANWPHICLQNTRSAVACLQTAKL